MSRNTHNKSSSKEYSTWCGMKQRCYNPTSKFYPYYGGRGIKICDRWLNSFENFFADMGERPDNHTIDRIDNEQGYSPKNCKWATRSEQQKNRRCNRFVTLNGITKTAMEWSEETGIAHQTLYARIDLGWKPEDILKLEKQINKKGLELGGLANGAKQRAKTQCKFGHSFDDANTSWYKGARRCKTCHREAEAIRVAKKRALKLHN
jgi:hypothetical protein